MTQQTVQSADERIEALLTELRAAPDPRMGKAAEEFAQTLVRLYGAGLAQLMTIIAADGAAGAQLLTRLTADPLVAALLLVHDLHPVSIDARIQTALDQVRPILANHAGGVEYQGVDDAGVVHLRLQGGCDGCPSADVTARHTIEEAVWQAAPEITGIAVEGLAEPTPHDRRPSTPTLLQIGRPSPTADTRAHPDTEQCEICSTILDSRHGHLVDVENRHLRCACRACYLLFTTPGSAQGRYRAVPERVRSDPRLPLTTADWATLDIPVGTAFVFVNSALDLVVGCYPSPTGATECELDPAAWQRLVDRYPLLRAAVPDLEAIYVSQVDGGVEAFLVPIDLCYRLVGQIRRAWRGLDGGSEVRQTLSDFVDTLRTRATTLEAGRG